MSLRECRKAGQFREPLCKVRRMLFDKIKDAYHNGVRGVLRHYLYECQPRELITKARLQLIKIEADGLKYNYAMELRDMTRPDRSFLRN